jgi:hypothetical protein
MVDTVALYVSAIEVRELRGECGTGTANRDTIVLAKDKYVRKAAP